jgi:alkanesulfonate monooxygenase SsuD/methylene tetrahydromethanopterin reductase-like flavin-dependent oxidoreductase (luciferase family)
MRFAVFSHIAERTTGTPTQRLKEFVAEARLADRLGFDYFFTTEHHFTDRFSLSPSPAVTLATLAQVTERIRFGPMVIILPINNPLRVVEELIVLDHMSGGRLEMGFGRGITPHEHITYGVRTQEAIEMFGEGLDFVLKAMTTTEPFSWLGKYYTYFDVQLPWRPLQQPHPPVWIPTNTPSKAFDYAKRGFGGGGFGTLGINQMVGLCEQHRKGALEAGRPEDDLRLSVMCSTLVAETDDAARALARENFSLQMKLFEDERIRSMAAGDSATREASEISLERLRAVRGDLDEAEASLRFVAGSPETVAAKIEQFRERLGIDTFIGEFAFGDLPYETVARSYELFAGQVMPAFQKPVLQNGAAQ